MSLSLSAPHRRPRPPAWIGCGRVPIQMVSSHCPRPRSCSCRVLSSRIAPRSPAAPWPWSPTPRSPRARRSSAWRRTERTWRPACWGTPCCTPRSPRPPWTCCKGNTHSSEPAWKRENGGSVTECDECRLTGSYQIWESNKLVSFFAIVALDCKKQKSGWD